MEELDEANDADGGSDSGDEETEVPMDKLKAKVDGLALNEAEEGLVQK